MANMFQYNDKKVNVGDTIEFSYKIIEKKKQRIQKFKGIVVKVRGVKPENKMFTIRKMTKSGIGVERIIPLLSPYLSELKIIKRSDYRKATAYFIRDLSKQELRRKLYRSKK